MIKLNEQPQAVIILAGRRRHRRPGWPQVGIVTTSRRKEACFRLSETGRRHLPGPIAPFVTERVGPTWCPTPDDDRVPSFWR